MEAKMETKKHTKRHGAAVYLWLLGGGLHLLAASTGALAEGRDAAAEAFESAMRAVETHMVTLEARGQARGRQLKVWASEDGGRIYMVEVDGATKRLGWMPRGLICDDKGVRGN
jgi:hypothetical protein